MKLVLVGTGYVGLVSGSCFAEFGYEVICVDKDEKKIKDIQLGKMPFFEEGLNELISKNNFEGVIDKNILKGSEEIYDQLDAYLCELILN